MTLDGRRILLTGGTTGIGRALLKRLTFEGARVLTLGREQGPLDEALALARDGGRGEAHGLTADLGRREDIARIFAELDDKLGGLDALVSNAGVAADPIDEMEDDAWRYAVEVNLVAPMACTREALKRLGSGGQVVIVGSISGVIHAPGESVYSATKAGLAAFVETLRKEVEARGVRVSLVAPGSVGTDMQEAASDEQRRKIANEEMLAADDVADAIGFILTRPTRADVVALRIEPRVQALT